MLLANAYVDHGDYGPAQAALGEILDLARQMVDPMLRASVYWSQSRVHLSQGDPDRAAEYANLALATLRASEQTLEAARALLLLAFIENDRGNPETALELVDEGEPIVTAAGETTDAAMFTIERARALSALGEGDEALALLLGIVPRLSSASPRRRGPRVRSRRRHLPRARRLRPRTRAVRARGRASAGRKQACRRSSGGDGRDLRGAGRGRDGPRAPQARARGAHRQSCLGER